MRISDVIRRKGDEVVTLRSDATVLRLLEILTQHHIGAVVVSDDGSTVSGIVTAAHDRLHCCHQSPRTASPAT
jgi:CBS domain-containing protein